MYPSSIRNLIECLKDLPGIGEKSAERLAYAIVGFDKDKLDNFANCGDIVDRFDAQEIFNATLYADGTIKMPDGQILTPRNPYDAAMIYDKNSNVRQRANSIYRKDTANIKKVEFKDASMAAGEQVRPLGSESDVKRVLSAPKRISRKK